MGFPCHPQLGSSKSSAKYMFCGVPKTQKSCKTIVFCMYIFSKYSWTNFQCQLLGRSVLLSSLGSLPLVSFLCGLSLTVSLGVFSIRVTLVSLKGLYFLSHMVLLALQQLPLQPLSVVGPLLDPGSIAKPGASFLQESLGCA